MAKTVKSNKPTYIYTLSHPLTQEIRYVGKTVANLSTRLRQHLYSAKKLNRTHTHKWINALQKKSFVPCIKLIDSCAWDKSQELEIYYIQKLKREGVNLLNHTEGGEGCLGRQTSEKTKQKQSQAIRLKCGKKVSQYTLDGKFVKTFATIIEVLQSLPEASTSKIVMVCKGKRRKHAGYRWSYKEVADLGSIAEHKQTGRPLTKEHKNKILVHLRKRNNWDRDLSGQKFGRLLVVEKLPMEGQRYSMCKVICDCGNTKIIMQNNLINSKHPTKSCGCLRKENSGRRKKEENIKSQ